MEKKSVHEIVSTVFKALTLAMGVAVVVLSFMGSLDEQTAITLLGIGLASAGVTICGDCPDIDHCQAVATIISTNPEALKNLRG